MAIKTSGVESHNALGVSERYHVYLRQVYRGVFDLHSSINKHDALRLAVKSVNDTAKQDGLVPTLLLFGVLPRLPMQPRDLPIQQSRFETTATARREMVKLTALARLNKALQTNAPAATDQSVCIGDVVLAYGKKEKRWLGPLTVIDSRVKGFVIEIEGKHRSFAINKINLYQKDTDTYLTNQKKGRNTLIEVLTAPQAVELRTEALSMQPIACTLADILRWISSKNSKTEKKSRQIEYVMLTPLTILRTIHVAQ